MPFLRSTTRPQAVECFFCLSPSLLPPAVTDRKGKGRLAEVGSKWNWRCERCGCWNLKDERGEMVSDIPAMHNSSLNKTSFSLRATPSTSRLPSVSASSTFCHSCLANQTLIMNMLANYLPDDDDPSFPSLYAQLPAYLTNLHARYPPVCSSCQPAVDAALRKSDQRAQGEALGFALRRGVTSQSEGGVTEGAGPMAVLVWRIRGLLFCIGTALSIGQVLLPALASQGYLSNRHLAAQSFSPTLFLLSFHILSILWIFWDPYWLRRARYQDRAKVRGRGIWIRNMFIILLIRITTSAFLYLSGKPETSPGTRAVQAAAAIEVALLIHALASLRISQPVSIQLVRPIASSSSLSSPSAKVSQSIAHQLSSSGLSTLSLDHNTSQQTNPIFGQPSLQTAHKSSTLPDQPEPMDWEPSPAAIVSNGGWTTRPPHWDPDEEETERTPHKSDWDGFGVGKQRLFPQPSGADETGLESLLSGWGLGGGSSGADGSLAPQQTRASTHPTGGLVINEAGIRKAMLALMALRLSGAVVLGISRNEEVHNGSDNRGSQLDLANGFLNGAEIAIGVWGLLSPAIKDGILRIYSPRSITLLFSVAFHCILPLAPFPEISATANSSLWACLTWVVWAVLHLICWWFA